MHLAVEYLSLWGRGTACLENWETDNGVAPTGGEPGPGYFCIQR
jgi:hypothetical protein